MSWLRDTAAAATQFIHKKKSHEHTAKAVLSRDPAPGGGNHLRAGRRRHDQAGACGVCHSDLSATNGTLPFPPPVVLGHEGAGTVIEVGEGVTEFAIGDTVLSSFVSMCGICRYCTTGRPSLCDLAAKAIRTLPDGTVRTHDAQGQPLSASGCGGGQRPRCTSAMW
jgi:hypothetical protein